MTAFVICVGSSLLSINTDVTIEYQLREEGCLMIPTGIGHGRATHIAEKLATIENP